MPLSLCSRPFGSSKTFQEMKLGLNLNIVTFSYPSLLTYSVSKKKDRPWSWKLHFSKQFCKASLLFFPGNYPVGSQEEVNFCGDEYIRIRLFSQVCRPAGGDGGRVRTLFSWFLRKLSNA